MEESKGHNVMAFIAAVIFVIGLLGVSISFLFLGNKPTLNELAKKGGYSNVETKYSSSSRWSIVRAKVQLGHKCYADVEIGRKKDELDSDMFGVRYYHDGENFPLFEKMSFSVPDAKEAAGSLKKIAMKEHWTLCPSPSN